jgi:hypothetical protein
MPVFLLVPDQKGAALGERSPLLQRWSKYADDEAVQSQRIIDLVAKLVN